MCAGDVFIARTPRSGWTGCQSKMTERRSRADERTAYQEGFSLPFSLFLRGKKRRIGSGEEGKGGRAGRPPIRRSTRPVGMECRYESSPLLHSRLLTFWPATLPSLLLLPVSNRRFFFFFLYASLWHPLPTTMLLTESSPCSTFCWLNHLLLHYCACLLDYYYYYYCFRLLLLLLLLNCYYVHTCDLVTICYLRLIFDKSLEN